ncbi:MULTISPECIES: hypothetical protein [Paraburkholderia]|uniref:Uncharacterized protein n=1 Tax=Paraburkholderia phenazinium TaxID=60549 RepID=A0A1N6K0K1_9BURK|nr:hypothetical protein [Paraburkholderia phenazinium]SIO49846.1 hypothetical protein SAMN05444168_5585 [Paraburkholderia phenazinium]
MSVVRLYFDFARDAHGLVTRIGAAMTKLHLKDAIFAVGKADLLGQNACDVVMAFNRFFYFDVSEKLYTHQVQDGVTGAQRGSVSGTEDQANEVAILSNRRGSSNVSTNDTFL